MKYFISGISVTLALLYLIIKLLPVNILIVWL